MKLTWVRVTSTHCLLFRPGVTLAFDLHGQTPGVNSSNIPVNARIATVGSSAPDRATILQLGPPMS